MTGYAIIRLTQLFVYVSLQTISHRPYTQCLLEIYLLLVKGPMFDGDHSSPSSINANNLWNFTTTYAYASWRDAKFNTDTTLSFIIKSFF